MSNREGIAALLIAVFVLVLAYAFDAGWLVPFAGLIVLIGLATLIWNLLAADREERAGRG